MSKHLFAFLLSELGATRILCVGCKSVIEIPLEALAAVQSTEGFLRCRFCNRDFNPLHKDASAILEFAVAAAKLRALKNVVDLEFFLPIDKPEAAPAQKK